MEELDSAGYKKTQRSMAEKETVQSAVTPYYARLLIAEFLECMRDHKHKVFRFMI